MINEIIALWSELLGREVNSTNDFFRSGGDSLIATKMINNYINGDISNITTDFYLSMRRFLCSFGAGKAISTRVLSSLIPLSAVSAPKPYHYFMVHASDGDPGVLPTSCWVVK